MVSDLNFAIRRTFWLASKNHMQNVWHALRDLLGTRVMQD